MRSSSAAVARVAVVHATENARFDLRPTGINGRQKADNGARFRRNMIVADSAILLGRAQNDSGVPMLRLAEVAGISQPITSRWISDPLAHPPPLYSVLAHPAVSVEAAALLLARAAEQLAAMTDPLDVREGVVRVRAATAQVEALLARRGML